MNVLVALANVLKAPGVVKPPGSTTWAHTSTSTSCLLPPPPTGQDGSEWRSSNMHVLGPSHPLNKIMHINSPAWHFSHNHSATLWDGLSGETGVLTSTFEVTNGSWELRGTKQNLTPQRHPYSHRGNLTHKRV